MIMWHETKYLFLKAKWQVDTSLMRWLSRLGVLAAKRDDLISHSYTCTHAHIHIKEVSKKKEIYEFNIQLAVLLNDKECLFWPHCATLLV